MITPRDFHFIFVDVQELLEPVYILITEIGFVKLFVWMRVCPEKVYSST